MSSACAVANDDAAMAAFPRFPPEVDKGLFLDGVESPKNLCLSLDPSDSVRFLSLYRDPSESVLIRSVDESDDSASKALSRFSFKSFPTDLKANATDRTMLDA